MRTGSLCNAALLCAAAAGCTHSAPAPGLDADAGVVSGGFDGGTFSDGTASVLQHHKDGTRAGLYVDPAFTRAAAQGLRRDTSFDGAVSGNVYAQLLYVESAGSGHPDAIVAATESNEVRLLDPTTGATIWRRTLGAPVALSRLPCGNIDPLGITGTPVADAASRTLYVAAMTTTDGGATKRHRVFAVSLDDGADRPGFPVDVEAAVPGFSSAFHNQRAALALLAGTVFVAYSGHYGDCSDYRGTVLAVPAASPDRAYSWRTRAAKGGIWAPPGLSSDGTSIYATTGNTDGATSWGDGEAVLRLLPSAPLAPADSFAPANWQQLDDADTDISGSGALLVHVPGATPSDVAVALGKDGKAYVLDRAHLGGIGGQLSAVQVANGVIINAPATFTTASGTYVVFHGAGRTGKGCPGDLAAVRLSAAAPPQAAGVWCASQRGAGSPIVTSPDGQGQPLVWSVGAEGDERLRAFDGETGEVVFDGGGAAGQMGQVRRYVAPIAARGRIYVGGDDRVYAFTTR